jgi:hypothetical protein
MDRDVALVPPERIERSILLIRGHKVMLDSDLAGLYGVTTKRLNEQVRRNLSRFPEDFMFQLTESETHLLRSQIAPKRRARRTTLRLYIRAISMVTEIRYSPILIAESE